MFLLLASLCCIIQHSFGYNLETELPVIRTGDAGSYFGFSVATHSFFDEYKDLDPVSQNYSWYGYNQLDIAFLQLYSSV